VPADGVVDPRLVFDCLELAVAVDLPLLYYYAVVAVENYAGSEAGIRQDFSPSVGSARQVDFYRYHYLLPKVSDYWVPAHSSFH
jgi:hypothetical protein